MTHGKWGGRALFILAACAGSSYAYAAPTLTGGGVSSGSRYAAVPGSGRSVQAIPMMSDIMLDSTGAARSVRPARSASRAGRAPGKFAIAGAHGSGFGGISSNGMMSGLLLQSLGDALLTAGGSGMDGGGGGGSNGGGVVTVVQAAPEPGVTALFAAMGICGTMAGFMRRRK